MGQQGIPYLDSFYLMNELDVCHQLTTYGFNPCRVLTITPLINDT
jgi:hypothetical protein